MNQPVVRTRDFYAPKPAGCNNRQLRLAQVAEEQGYRVELSVDPATVVVDSGTGRRLVAVRADRSMTVHLHDDAVAAGPQPVTHRRANALVMWREL